MVTKARLMMRSVLLMRTVAHGRLMMRSVLWIRTVANGRLMMKSKCRQPQFPTAVLEIVANGGLIIGL